jgi:iron complex outermembrane receptor protein
LLTQQGLNGNNALPSTAGSFNVYEGFAEAIVPIIQDRPFFKSLSLRGAVPVSQYNTMGQTFSYNYGGEWAPVDANPFPRDRGPLCPRAECERTVFSRRSRTSRRLAGSVRRGHRYLDRCAFVKLPRGSGGQCQHRSQYGCRHQPCNGRPYTNAFTATQDVQGITSFGGGNPNLHEEKGDSFTAGVVIAPRSDPCALRNFTLTVDYFNIRVKDAIVSTPLQFILDQCYNQSNTALCQL